MMKLEEKLALIEKHYAIYEAWRALFKAREAVAREYFNKYNKASNTYLWHLETAYRETDEKRKEKLNALCEKLKQISETYWSARCYWDLRSEDAYKFADAAFQEMVKVTER